MNKKLELALRACHQNTDDALQAGVVSLFHLGLLQHGQAFMIKAMTRFPNSFAACGLNTLWERKRIGLDLLSAAEISAMSSAVITCNLQFDWLLAHFYFFLLTLISHRVHSPQDYAWSHD